MIPKFLSYIAPHNHWKLSKDLTQSPIIIIMTLSDIKRFCFIEAKRKTVYII